MNDNLPIPIALYRARMTAFIRRITEDSQQFLIDATAAHASGKFSDDDIRAAWEEFIAASTTLPAGVIFAAPSEAAASVATLLCSILAEQLRLAAAERGLSLELEWKSTPLEETPQQEPLQ